MRLALALVVGSVFGLVVSGQAQRSAWPILPKDPRGFEVGVWNYYPQTASPTPGHTVHNLIVAFDNHSTKEVASVEFEMTLMRDGKPVMKKGPIHVDRFADHYFMSRHGAVPGQRTFADIPIPFDLPVGAWEPRDGADVKILSYKVVSDPQNLHDLGHFATWLKTSSDAQVEKEMKRDPSLRRVHNEDGYTALAVAYFFGSSRKVRAVTGGPSFGEPEFPGGMSAFHLAVRNSDVNVLDAALSLGADPNAHSDSGFTPLMIAVNNYSEDAVRWLLRHNVDVESVDKAGWNALRYAIRTTDRDLVRLLVDHGARLTTHNAEGYGPMHYATARDAGEILQVLLAAGASVNDVDPAFGITPLMAAAKYRNNRAAFWLAAHGARLDAKDRQGKDAFDYARDASPTHSDAEFRSQVENGARQLPERPKT
jgi:ankyrin repeat protein